MFTPATSRHFVAYTDPKSHVVSYVLKNELAPLQKPLYFVSRSESDDGRYFWFLAIHAPNGLLEGASPIAAVIDFETDEVRAFPDCTGEAGACDPETGCFYWVTQEAVLRRTPNAGDPVEVIGRVPDAYFRAPGERHLATHLTLSADRKNLMVDIIVGSEVYMTSLCIETGKFSCWRALHGGWDHAQFHPTIPDLALYAAEYWQDPITGRQNAIDADTDGKLMRMWMIRRGEHPVLLKGAKQEASHEWWSADGNYVYYCDWKEGVGRIDWRTGRADIVVPHPARHAYASRDNRYFCLDEFVCDPVTGWFFRGCATRAFFYDTQGGKLTPIISENPALYAPEAPCVYHIDAHPRFVFGDAYIAHCTTVTNQVSVAFTPVKNLQ